MIAFFRRIRQQLLAKNKVSRYLLYALGEIALVMIGILLALQVNGWNKARTDQIEEQQVLRQLKMEFETNRTQIQDKIQLHREIVASGLSILGIVDAPEDLKPLDSLYFHLGKTLTAPTFDPSLGVTNDLINSGKLYLIKSDSLRRLISGWSGDIVFATEEELIWRKMRDEKFIPFLIESMSFRNIVNAANGNKKIKALMNFGRTYEALNAGPSKIHKIVHRRFQVSELEALEDQVIGLTNFNHICITQMTELRNVVDHILEIIDKEIVVTQ